MKKILFMAAALLAFAACENNINPDVQPVDEITIAPDSKTFAKDGGEQAVIVTSSAEWTLEAKEAYDWIRPDIKAGKDGDIVTFTADANYSGKDKDATFTFTCGTAVASFVAKSHSGDLCKLELASKSSVETKYVAGSVEIVLNTNANPKHLTKELTSGADWCSFNTYIETETGYRMVFDLKANSGRESRSAEIVLGVDKSKEPGAESVESVKVNLVQRAKPILSTDLKVYNALPEGGNVEMVVDANIEYSVAVVDGNWLTHKGVVGGKEVFSASKFNGTRECKVKFTEKNPLEGEQAVVTEVIVKQAPSALVSKVINMDRSRMWMNKSIGHKDNFTIEMLVKATDLTTDNGVQYLFGWQNFLAMRIGGYASDLTSGQLNLWGGQCTATGNGKGGFKYADYDGDQPYIGTASGKLPDKEWHHVALVMKTDGLTNFGAPYLCEIYLDGKMIHNGRCNKHVRLGIGGDFFGQKFYFGAETSFNQFRGCMAEIRVWDKALTADELNVENHFYTVDPKSPGLQAYFKFDVVENKGNGYEVEDQTGNGYKLWYENAKSGYDGTAAPDLIDVVLP